MTDPLLSVDSVIWELAVEEFEIARAACDENRGADDQSRFDAIFDRYQEAEEALLALAAPDFEAVIEKLQIIWADELALETPDSIPMMMVVGDLRRLTGIDG